jgi:hypothetical protein
MVDAAHLRFAPRTAHPHVPNVLKICPHNSSYTAPVRTSDTTFAKQKGPRPSFTSFDDRALLVKSLQHDMKQRSTRFEYIRMKSCILIEMIGMGYQTETQ